MLCALPDPTMISKVGCIAMGVHASDQLAAATNQLVTGRATDPYAFKAGAYAAEAMGASRTTGRVIGLATEFAVPLSTAALHNAFRVSSVQAGRMTVAVSEKFPHAPKVGPGGHTVQFHVAKDVTALQKRLKRKRSADVMSTFSSLEKAEWAVGQVLRVHRYKVLAYSKARLLRTDNRVVLKMDFAQEVGWGITRSAPDTPSSMKRVLVVVEFTEYNRMPAFIVTAYPIP